MVYIRYSVTSILVGLSGYLAMALLSLRTELTNISDAVQSHPFIGITACNSLLGNVSVTVDVCVVQCGTGYHPYSTLEVVSAVSSWVIPLFVLVGNIELSNLQVGTAHKLWGLRRSTLLGRLLNVFLSYGAVVNRLMGNPIQFLWSHLERLEQMHLRSRTSHPSIAVLDIALDDFDTNPARPSIASYTSTLAPSTRAAFLATCRPAAAHLRNNRLSSMRRSVLAVAAYTIILFVSLKMNVEQQSEAVHTPHTIALRELYYWLFSAVALSSAAGAFPTTRSARGFLAPVLTAMRDGAPKLRPLGLWSGGSYAFVRSPGGDISLGLVLRLVVAAVMVTGAWVFSFTTSWFTPTRGLGCRSLMELCYLAVWIANFSLSLLATRVFPKWWPAIVSVLDLCVSVPTVICLFTAFQGWYNSCMCWGAGFTPFIEHWIPKNIQEQEYTLTSMYYGLIGGAVGFQVLMSTCVLWYYRRELYLIYGVEAVEEAETEEGPEPLAATAERDKNEVIEEIRLLETISTRDS